MTGVEGKGLRPWNWLSGFPPRLWATWLCHICHLCWALCLCFPYFANGGKSIHWQVYWGGINKSSLITCFGENLAHSTQLRHTIITETIAHRHRSSPAFKTRPVLHHCRAQPGTYWWVRKREVSVFNSRRGRLQIWTQICPLQILSSPQSPARPPN